MFHFAIKHCFHLSPTYCPSRCLPFPNLFMTYYTGYIRFCRLIYRNNKLQFNFVLFLVIVFISRFKIKARAISIQGATKNL